VADRSKRRRLGLLGRLRSTLRLPASSESRSVPARSLSRRLGCPVHAIAVAKACRRVAFVLRAGVVALGELLGLAVGVRCRTRATPPPGIRACVRNGGVALKCRGFCAGLKRRRAWGAVRRASSAGCARLGSCEGSVGMHRTALDREALGLREEGSLRPGMRGWLAVSRGGTVDRRCGAEPRLLGRVERQRRMLLSGRADPDLATPGSPGRAVHGPRMESIVAEQRAVRGSARDHGGRSRRSRFGALEHPRSAPRRCCAERELPAGVNS